MSLFSLNLTLFILDSLSWAFDLIHYLLGASLIHAWLIVSILVPPNFVGFRRPLYLLFSYS